MASQGKHCDGCGGPPRADDETMLRCARCKQAWYHDASCQRRHWPDHKELCRGSSAASDEAGTGRRRCRNEHVSRPETTHIDDRLVVPHVIPRMYDALTQDELSATWTHDVRMLLSGYEYPPCRLAPLKEGERALLYHDVRDGNPFEQDDDSGRFTEKWLVLLSPIEAESFQNLPPPSGLVRASDLHDNENFTKDEQVAVHLNGFNVRCHVQKWRQENNHAFVLLIEFDVREGTDETTLTLTVTTLANGLDDLGDDAPTTTRRRFLFRAPRSKDTPDFVADSFSRSHWAPVRGLVPLGIDYVLARPDYASALSAAREAGRTTLVQLCCRSPVLAGAGEPRSTDEYCTRMVYWMQTVMHKGYDVGVQLNRLPDGYTGDEVEDPADVLRIMRRLEDEGRFVDQPLLTAEERCVPEETHEPEAFVVSVADTLVQPEVDWDRVYSMESGDKRGLRARVKYMGDFFREVRSKE